MMKIDIKHIAKLARLSVDESETKRFEQEMENIVAMIENLPQIKDSSGMSAALINPENPMILREDISVSNFKRDELMKNAPQTKAGCVVVPKVMD